MHELSIAEAIVSQAENIAREHSCAYFGKITLSIGRLSGVDSDALRMAMPIASENTCLSRAELAIETVEPSVYCRSCRETTGIELPFFICGKCGSAEVDIIQGRELLIKSLEFDTGEN